MPSDDLHIAPDNEMNNPNFTTVIDSTTIFVCRREKIN